MYPPYWINLNAKAVSEMEAAAGGDLGSPDIQRSRFDAILNFDRRDELSFERRDVLLGSAMVLKLIGGTLATVSVVLMVLVLRPGDWLSFWLVVLFAVGFVTQSLNGSVAIDFATEGLTWKLSIPTTNLVAEPTIVPNRSAH